MVFSSTLLALLCLSNHTGHNGTLGISQGLVVGSPGDRCPDFGYRGDELAIDLFYVNVLHGIYHPRILPHN